MRDFKCNLQVKLNKDQMHQTVHEIDIKFKLKDAGIFNNVRMGEK